MAEEDIGQRIMDKLDELDISLRKKESFLKKNAHLHIMIESDILNDMKKKAEEEGLSLAGWCRKKLRDDSQLDRIEKKLNNLCKS